MPAEKIPAPRHNISFWLEITVVSLSTISIDATIASFTKISLQAEVLPLYPSGVIFQTGNRTKKNAYYQPYIVKNIFHTLLNIS
ncbi:MAG: hypothetical protein HRF42_03935 [Candidatus Brocadia sp.]|jgi:hypothetical protein